ncbi:DUF3080 domain-containing protein [Photobacterium lutimaris]|uniref:DUF3080 domain-containing protein n=1 Tax=Photobacterium lutimaris TaxID=388278 RepID=A0A2T3J1C8_9GAMM|nr:DUF3080 domain-containing protein [Photobacterium lutimaris]PSU34892.1 DUF3080 domain-containing protein [Photobacterium lutimaris]TDR77238.1 DUF3080 family protein [Photobacterium lutimaris]
MHTRPSFALSPRLFPFRPPAWRKGHLCFVLLLIIFLAGCEPNTTKRSFDTYNNRLANVLETSPVTINDGDLSAFPVSRELLLPIEDIRIDLLDAYELRKCGLFNLIAERNSILGKVQDKTRQLRYELILLSGLNHCQQVLPEDSDVLPMLEGFKQQKQAQLNNHLWNMLTTEKEWRQQLTIHYQPFELGLFYGFDENLNAFNYLTFIQQHIRTGTSVEEKQANRLIQHQKQLHAHHYFGQLIYSMHYSSLWLESITEMLEQHEATLICGPNRNQQKAEYLSNVFYKFFANELQPYLAELDSQYSQVTPALIELLAPAQSQSPALVPYYKQYLGGRLHDDFRQVTLKHVGFWQRTFKRCNIKVGVR